MLLITEYGYYLVARDPDAPERLLIRTHRRAHLEHLLLTIRDEFGEGDAHIQIRNIRHQNPPYQVSIERHRWEYLQQALARDIEYVSLPAKVRLLNGSTHPFTRYVDEAVANGWRMDDLGSKMGRTA